jgi:hypothetical protein
LPSRRISTALGPLAVGRELLDVHLRIQRSKHRRGDLQARDDDRLPAHHRGREACVGRYRRGGRDIAADAEILGERSGDEFVEIEACGKRHGARLSERPRRG